MRSRRRPRRLAPPRHIHRAEPFLAAAARSATRLGHGYIGTEHLLLALAEDAGSPAARVLGRLGLTSDGIHADIVRLIGLGDTPRTALDPDALATLGIDLDEVRRRVEQAFGRGALDRTAAGCTPLMPRLKRALEHAGREAGQSPMRAEHLLLGCAAVEDCVAARILRDHGVTAAALRAELHGEPRGQQGG